MKRVFLLLLASTAMLTTAAFTQPDDDDPPFRGKMMEKLKLTDTQHQQMQKLHLALQKQLTQLHAKVQGFRLEVKEQYISDKPDKKAIERSLKGINDAQLEMKYALVDHWFAVNNILTPEQQKVWKMMAARITDRGFGAFRQGRGPRWQDDDDDGPGFGPGPQRLRMHRP